MISCTIFFTKTFILNVMMITSHWRILKSISLGFLAHIYPLLMLHENGLFQMFRVMGKTYFGKIPRKTIYIIFHVYSISKRIVPFILKWHILHYTALFKLECINQLNLIIEQVTKVVLSQFDIFVRLIFHQLFHLSLNRITRINSTLKCMIYVTIILFVLWEMD